MRAFLSATALVVFWSSGFIGARLGTEYAPADTLLAWRYLAAALLLAVALRRAGVRPTRAAWKRQTRLGLLCQVGYLGGIVTGVGLGVPAGTAALIAALQPLVVAALAPDRVSRRQLVGLVAGLLGVALVVSGDLSTGAAAWWAYSLPVGGMLALSVGTVLGDRLEAAEGLLEALTLQTVVAAMAFAAVAAARSALEPPATAGFWWAVVWTVGLSSFGGYGAYLFVLRTSGPNRVSTLLYLTPPTTMIWAAVMFGTPITLPGVIGTAVCAGGVALVLAPPVRRLAPLRADVASWLRGSAGRGRSRV